MTFAEHLKAAREKARLSCDELAERAGFSRAAIYNLEAGADPKWSTVCVLADVLGVPVGYFRDGKGAKK